MSGANHKIKISCKFFNFPKNNQKSSINFCIQICKNFNFYIDFTKIKILQHKHYKLINNIHHEASN
jgi:hypothetical protein